MAGSLQDQFLAAGLIKKQKANNIQTAKKKAAKQSRANNTELVDEASELAKKAQDDKRHKSQDLNKKRKEESEQNAIKAQIAQIIEMNSIEKSPKKMPEDDLLVYNFTDDMIIKTVLVSPHNHDLISNGKIAIAKLSKNKNTSYELIPAIAASKINERDHDSIVLLNDKNTQDDNQQTDDPYADYQIPDDLMW